MGFLSHRVKRSDLEAGDHIYTWRTPVYAYAHHGIYIGDDKVVHFTQDQLSSPNSSFTSFSSVPDTVATCLYLPDCSCRERRSGVIRSCLNCFLGKGSLHRFEYGVSGVAFVTKIRGGICTTAKSDPPEDVIHRARHLLLQNGFGNYGLLTNNCEHFALYCKTGLVNGQKPSGGSGQVEFIVGVPVSAILALPLGLFFSIPAVLGAAVGNYTLNRYASDLGVRRDVVKMKVEDLAASHGMLLSADQEDAGLLVNETEVKDLAVSNGNLLSAEEDVWQLKSGAEVEVEDVAASHGNLLSTEEDVWLLKSGAEVEVEVEDVAASHGNLLSTEEDAWQLKSVAEVEVEDVAASHGNLLSTEEDVWLLKSGAEVEVEDVAASHGNLLSTEDDVWLLKSLAEVEVEDLAASNDNLLSAEEDAWQL